MLELLVQELTATEEWCLVIEAYRDAEAAAKAKLPDETPWIPRLREVPGVPTAKLTKLHGRLIALGLLKFELEGRATGMRYQVSSFGRRALEQGSISPDLELAELPTLPHAA